jgi:hypothetical protein
MESVKKGNLSNEGGGNDGRKRRRARENDARMKRSGIHVEELVIEGGGWLPGITSGIRDRGGSKMLRDRGGMMSSSMG